MVIKSFFFIFFSFQFCDVAHTSDHPQEGLAKFGYKSERKVENFKNPTIISQLVANYCQSMAISGKKKFPKSFWHFFFTIILCIVTLVFLSKVTQICKTTTTKTNTERHY
jgi:hypothetical protein